MSDTALGIAVGGLNAALARINTVSRNIANASTDGYTRKNQEQFTGPLGGVFIGGISRAVDDALLLSRRETGANLGRLDAAVEFRGLIETNFGSPDQNSSIAGVIKKLESVLRDAAVSPEKTTLYSAVVNTASEVARSFNTLYESAESIRDNAIDRVNEAVSDINDGLERIRQLNVAIVGGRQSLDVTDLEDQRDQEILRLGELLDFTTFKQANGAVNIYTRQGQPLLDAKVNAISANSIVSQPSSPPVVGELVIRSGSLGGLLAVRDQTIPGIEAQLDDMARALTAEFDAIGIPLFNDGGTTPLIDPVVDPAGFALQIPGYARRIAVNETIRATPTLIRDGNSPTPLDPGDGTFLQQAVGIFSRTDIAFTATTGLPATGGLVQVVTDFVAGNATARADAEDARAYQKALKDSFEAKISEKSGVNLDQEMSTLITLQQAYAANARVAQTTVELLDRLLDSV